MIQLTSGEWAAGITFILILLVFALKRPLFRWADAHHARKAAQHREDDHDGNE
jgi:hypothetical protein